MAKNHQFLYDFGEEESAGHDPLGYHLGPDLAGLAEDKAEPQVRGFDGARDGDVTDGNRLGKPLVR